MGVRKRKCTPTLVFHWTGMNTSVEGSENSFAGDTAKELGNALTRFGSASRGTKVNLIFCCETLFVANDIVVALSVINMVKQELVSDILSTSEHRHQLTLGVNSNVRHFRVSLLRNTPVSHGIETVNSVELLHVHDVAADVYRSRVSLFLD